MKYHLTRTKIYFSKIVSSIRDFVDILSYNVCRSLSLVKNSEKTKFAGYHAKRAGNNFISKTKENAWNWNHRLISSESFRIFDEDV